jgi:hypothetical protein
MKEKAAIQLADNLTFPSSILAAYIFRGKNTFRSLNLLGFHSSQRGIC